MNQTIPQLAHTVLETTAASWILSKPGISFQVLSDMEEDSGEANKENVWELSCETVREQLANSIRKQWRMLKNHVENLDNQGKSRDLHHT